MKREKNHNNFECLCGASFSTFNEFKKHVLSVHHSTEVGEWLV